MTEPAIRARGLGKRYRFAARPERSLRAAIEEGAARLLRRRPREDHQPVWALRDLDFEVGRGEFIGIIGRNGSGKSTLLKLISRLTRPTEGRLEIRGKVGSLLEVGVGFNPEFTGRENVQLNAAIMGIDPAELARRFDEIVDFSGVGRFIDIPVKRYSSGMTMRLGFAVAAHADADILLLDEVLAVGDAAFQQRCLEKVRAIRRQGRTVLYVSHGLEPIREHCDRVLWLDAGRALAFDEPAAVVDAYETRELTPAAIREARARDDDSAANPDLRPTPWPGLTPTGRQARQALAASFLGQPDHLIELGHEPLLRHQATSKPERVLAAPPGFTLAWADAALAAEDARALVTEATTALRALARARRLALEGPHHWPRFRELLDLALRELHPRILLDAVLDLGETARDDPAARPHLERLRRRLVLLEEPGPLEEEKLEARVATRLFGCSAALEHAFTRRRELVLAKAELGFDEARFVLRGDGALRVESAPQAWSHAVTLPLGEGSGPALIQLRARIDEGVFGVAGLGLDGSRIIGERFLAARPELDQHLEIVIPELAEAPRLLLRCGELEGQPARGRLFQAALLRPA